MIPSRKCIDLIKQFEGIYLQAYKCPASVWTIGYGSTFYENGKKVKEGEKITLKRAEELLSWEVTVIASRMPDIIVNQNQYDALVSFAYNVGMGALNRSTLLQKVIANPNDETIRDEFMKWCKARVNGELRILKGLQRRRKAEADLYES